MAKKVSNIAGYKFNNFERFARGSTTVVVGEKGATLLLHGNEIAFKDYKGKVTFTLAGWPTVTTRDRLQGAGIWVSQKKFEQYYNGNVIDPYKWYEVE